MILFNIVLLLMCLVLILLSDFYLRAVFLCEFTNDDVKSHRKIKTGGCDMNSITDCEVSSTQAQLCIRLYKPVFLK
ncbi:hypothetical protein ENB89_22695 [Salmonella enterica subsp. enterica serovar Idikan]|nr:hypothetical protein [Salmonella enterica subsp. enterica serovar Epalinges]EAR1915822.1 hypothetical protein [Salmonella enterica]EBS4914703.1 hypothetical protein [Salmonella enterica subsp. enterica serovar Idikan]EBX0159927.1 hypothetical protein [Salmonella enterica subsp. enterica serovar Kingabwa]EBZ6301029.1 hypothetical protein [Salmonella enterica subsp. enterica serovar Gombe]EBZ8468091.1 hypothetical protein [Salmonella enterica subsp. enterica serovar Mishmarhaemek]ECI0248383.